MGKLEKLEKLQKLKENGTITEQEFNTEKEKLMSNKNINNKRVKVIIAVIIILVLIIGGAFAVYYFTNNKSTETSSNESNETTSEDGFEQTSANLYANGTDNVSFANMNSDDENYNSTQQEILKYFDNNYFVYNSSLAQKYPQIFKEAKVQLDCTVVKVLSSTDDEFSVVVINYFMDQGAAISENLDELNENSLLILKGKQLSKRLVKGDWITVYGRYNDVVTNEIDGKSYTIPQVTAINVLADGSQRFEFNTIKTVAEYIFGKDIKINEPVYGQDYRDGETINGVETYYNGEDASFYKGTLDNQSNANFKVFNMYKDNGVITYNRVHNGLSNNIQKNLWVSADFQHYIVSTYDEDLKYVYIDYFDKDLNKVWSREFQYTSTKAFASPMDYTDEQMAVVVDNDLYLIDLETGENIIEPVIVGEKVKVNMIEDGIILIGDNTKDTIMKVDYTGKVLFRTDTSNLTTIEGASTQIVNGKMVVYLTGTWTDPSDGSSYPDAEFLVINSDGTLEVETEGF